MGIVNNILQIIDTEVSADGGRVPRDAASVQQPRCKNRESEDEKEIEKQDEFCLAIGGSLQTIALNTMINSLLRKEEEFLLTFTEALKDAEESKNDRKRRLYEEKVKFHKTLVNNYRKKLNQMQGVVSDEVTNEEEGRGRVE
jgi:hypothetical protein